MIQTNKRQKKKFEKKLRYRKWKTYKIICRMIKFLKRYCRKHPVSIVKKEDIPQMVPKPPKVEFKPTIYHIVLPKLEGDDTNEQETEKEV